PPRPTGRRGRGAGRGHRGRGDGALVPRSESAPGSMTMVILETERLILRHLEPDDVMPLFVLYRDPEMRRYFPDGTLTLEETGEEIDWFRHGHPRHPELGLWATVERSSGAFLGRCGLLPWTIDGEHEVELAYLIDKARWGEGL